jgi:hypothetical protein
MTSSAERRIEIRNDAFQRTADAALGRAFLDSLTMRDLRGIADLNHIEHDDMSGREITEALIADRHPQREVPARNVTVGRGSTVHATIDNDGYTALCGGSMRRNGHRGEPTPAAERVTCRACLKALDRIKGIVTSRVERAPHPTMRARHDEVLTVVDGPHDDDETACRLGMCVHPLPTPSGCYGP